MQSSTASIPRYIVGHAARTTNAAESNPATALLGGLWERTTSDAALLHHPERTDDRLCAVLFDYESDESGAYTQIVGIGIDAPTSVPVNTACIRVGETTRREYAAHGEMPQALIATWGQVWSEAAAKRLRRDFTAADIEVHTSDGSATILVAVAE